MVRLQRSVPRTFDEVEKAGEVYLCPKVVLDEDRCDIQSQEGISIATMNKKAHSILRSLFLEYKIQYQGLLPKLKFMEKLDAATHPVGLDSSNVEISMSLLIFGLRLIADSLAKALSRHRLFLQHPSIPTHKLYENPQYPLAITSSFRNGTILPPISVTAAQVDTEAEPPIAAVNEDAEDLIAVINDLPRHDYLNGVAHIDSRIRATLLPQVIPGQSRSKQQTDRCSHQKEAVDFAMRREIGIMGPRSLWCLDPEALAYPTYLILSLSKIVGTNTDIPTRFIHQITGFKSPCANDMLGGILADDMGLGKSLTMIVTIVMTMANAENFVQGRLGAHYTAKNSKIPIKSTLIIVPSACMFLVTQIPQLFF